MRQPSKHPCPSTTRRPIHPPHPLAPSFPPPHLSAAAAAEVRGALCLCAAFPLHPAVKRAGLKEGGQHLAFSQHSCARSSECKHNSVKPTQSAPDNKSPARAASLEITQLAVFFTHCATFCRARARHHLSARASIGTHICARSARARLLSARCRRRRRLCALLAHPPRRPHRRRQRRCQRRRRPSAG